MRQLYGTLFAQSPQLHVEVPTRIRVGNYVIDEERGTGLVMEGFHPEIHAAVVYRLADNLIHHVRLLA